jgi:hypothetical protein
MGKRSNFKRPPADFYPTPRAAVLPLVPYLAAVASGLLPSRVLATGPWCGWVLVGDLPEDKARSLERGDVEPRDDCPFDDL